MSDKTISTVVMFGLLLRCLVALHGYSGEGKPPLFGDYEAQRHWMEITFNLPIKDWYFDTSENDLYYWGLDYPPLTAYHSWLCGLISSYLNPKYVELYNSRGYESQEHKFFMRFTVIIADFVTYIYATYIFTKSWCVSKNELVNTSAFLMLTYPGFILIDHGHFQYNCISLGLALFSVINLFKDRDITASILFCLSLCYKQMLLYYSLPIFFFLLGKCIKRIKTKGLFNGVFHLFKLTSSVILTFCIVWYPFILDKKQVLQVLHRIFPLARGVFEDKVSNIWCVLNLFYKFKYNLSNDKMAVICAVTTLISVLPSCYNIFINTKKEKLVLGLFNSALGFFLFSFQVHEKSILIVALAAMLCFKYEPLHCFWFLFLSNFSMLPLFIKDKLIIPFLALSVFYVISLINVIPLNSSKLAYRNKYFKVYYIHLSIIGCCFFTLMSLLCNPPNRYPDLFSLLISVYSALHFVYFFVYFNFKQFKVNAPKHKVT